MKHEQSKYEALVEAVQIAGGQSSFARICGVSQAAVWKWLQSAKRLPAEFVLRVEAATGVSRHALRPDIYPHDLPSLPASAIGEPTPLCGPILSQRRSARACNPSAALHSQTRSTGEAA